MFLLDTFKRIQTISYILIGQHKSFFLSTVLYRDLLLWFLKAVCAFKCYVS